MILYLVKILSLEDDIGSQKPIVLSADPVLDPKGIFFLPSGLFLITRCSSLLNFLSLHLIPSGVCIIGEWIPSPFLFL